VIVIVIITTTTTTTTTILQRIGHSRPVPVKNFNF
jgi:hypothetical protein